MLARLEGMGLLHVTTVDVSFNPANEYVDFYDYFCAHLGGRHVPVILIDKKIFMVPSFYTIVGHPKIVAGGKKIDMLGFEVQELERIIVRYLEKAEEQPTYPPTHSAMVERIMREKDLRGGNHG